MQNMSYEAIDGLNMLFINDRYPVKPVEDHPLLDPDRVKSVTIIHQSTQSRVYLVTYKSGEVIKNWWEGDRRGAFVVHNDTHYIDLTDDDYESMINAVDFIEMQQRSEEATGQLLSASPPIPLPGSNESKCIFKVFAHDYPPDDVTAEYELMNGLKEQLEGQHGTLGENCEQFIFECEHNSSNPNVILIQTPSNAISHKRYRVLRGEVEKHKTPEGIYSIFENTLANNGQDPIINQLFTIIHCIHSAGYYHRDIKPDNFVISGEGEDRKIHLIDFGLTVAPPISAATDWQPATPDYLSPFMAHAKTYFRGLSDEDKKTLLIANDYWAIVCTIIYFMYSMSWRTHTLNGIALQDMPYLPVEMWLRPAVFNNPRVKGMSRIFREFLHIKDIVEEYPVQFTEERPLGVTFRNSDNMEVFIADIKNDTPAANAGLKRGWVVSKVDEEDVRSAPVSKLQGLLMDPKPITVVFLRGVVPESINKEQNIIDAEGYISKIENITLPHLAAAPLAPPPLAAAPPVSSGSKKYRQKKKTKRSFRTRKSRTRKPKTRKGRKTKKKRQKKRTKKRTKKKQRTRRK